MSGYDIEKFEPPPDPDLVCCICQCVLDKAVECPCRHVFCQSCIERWLTNRHTCPTCRKRTRKQDLKPVLPLVQNMLNRLLMICDYRDNGCFEKIMLEHFERHIKNCGYEMKTCRFSKCGAQILRMHLDDHENEQCEHRETACEGECGLMIPLSDRPTHNCVAALKAHIDEKNKMIEQLKVKLHELNNLSQSLNDQLVELRQQLNDRNQIFSSDSSDSSDSDVTDFMSDDLSRDSFRDSWFDSAASNISADNDDTTSNNGAGQESNNAGATEGSDVVEQVERTVVNSLFELSSRLERVRNQMRAVLNSRLVQEQNTLNDDVRIPSAAELDAIVNSNNNDNNNNSEAGGPASNISNEYNYNNNDNGHDDANQQNTDDNNNAGNVSPDFMEDENHSNDRYSYANDSQWSNLTEENPRENASGSDVSDLNWISDSDSNHTPYNLSPFPSPPSPENSSTSAYESFRTDNGDTDNQNTSEHVILSQPPDSPSDTTGSFSSIPSTSSVANSPSRDHDQEDDSLQGSLFTATPITNNQSSPAQSDRSFFNTTDNNSSSDSASSHSLQQSHRNDEENEEHSATFSNSSPARSFSSISSADVGNDSKSEDICNDTNDNACLFFITSAENSDQEGSHHVLNANRSPLSEISAVTDSELDDREVQNAQKCKTANKCEYFETNCVDSSLDYGESIEEGHDVDNLSETSIEGLYHCEMQEESDDTVNDMKQRNEGVVSDNSVSRCEPDSTLSPSTVHQQQQMGSLEESCANTPVLISTATESADSDDSDSVKYLTKHARRIEKSNNYPTDMNELSSERIPETSEMADPGSTVDSGFITGSISPFSEISELTGNKKYSSRKRKSACNTFVSDESKKSKSCGVSSRSLIDQTSQSYMTGDINGGTETVQINSADRYGFRKRIHDNDNSSNDFCKKNRGGVTSHYSIGQANTHRSRTSPPRNRQSWRELPQHWRRNRSSAGRRSNQAGGNENNAQSLNVKIDLSLINYSGHIGTETTSGTIPTTAVVHSAISPVPTATSLKREPGHTGSWQHIPDTGIKSSTPKQDEMSHKNNSRQRSSRSQRQELHCTTKNIHSSPARVPSNNSSNRDFPNSWRDSSDSSSDNTWEPGSDCDEMDDTITEGEDGFETDSSYEVHIPKSTAALLEEYASDESDASWKVGMK